MVDGIVTSYDCELLKDIVENTSIPIVALGGAGNINDIIEVFEKTNVSAAAAGSLFIYYGPLNGVLINYPEYETIKSILNIDGDI